MLNKISFCTVSMNRLEHLKKTLEKNIIDNIDYPKIEFVVLDYNSKDKLETWIYKSFKKFLKSGVLKYYRTNQPQFFHRSHSRNLAFKLATGDIICNLDADNFTGKGFAFYIMHRFSLQKNIFLSSSALGDSFGRVCVRRKHFYGIRGYDERMSGWGHEDNDLYERLKISGLEQIPIKELGFLKTIQHPISKRINNEKHVLNLKDVYINYEIPSKSQLLYLFKDKTLRKGEIIFDDLDGLLKLNQANWCTGNWELANNNLTLMYRNKTYCFEYDRSHNLLINDKVFFYKIPDGDFKNDVLLQYTALSNFNRYLNHKKNSKAIVNTTNWGELL